MHHIFKVILLSLIFVSCNNDNYKPLSDSFEYRFGPDGELIVRIRSTNQSISINNNSTLVSAGYSSLKVGYNDKNITNLQGSTFTEDSIENIYDLDGDMQWDLAVSYNRHSKSSMFLQSEIEPSFSYNIKNIQWRNIDRKDFQDKLGTAQ